jgi:hypothetical protein
MPRFSIAVELLLCAATARAICGGTLISPAMADGRLYARDGKEVICLQLGD